MTTYVPFLKSKVNEINALGELTTDIRSSITPFFDYPRKPNLTGAHFQAGVQKMVRSFARHVGLGSELYFDTYDLDDNLRVGAFHNYHFALESLEAFSVIPVISVDRHRDHLAAVTNLKTLGKISSAIVACRLTEEDFDEYAITSEDIAARLEAIFEQFENIDLIFDCRVCSQMDPVSTADRINTFSTQFCSDYPVRRVIVTGSSIPASAGDILRTQTERLIPRQEISIYNEVRAIHLHSPLVFGDYATVSPLYSDLDLAPEILQNVMTAKMTYTLQDSHFFIRGAGLRINGRGQYFTMARALCSKTFFRGRSYSSGDEYFDQKGRGLGSNCGPNTVIKPSVNSHISYMVRSGIR